MKKPVYIYTISDPDTKEVRYVGSSTDPVRRFANHKTGASNTRKSNWLRDLRMQGKKPVMRVIDVTDPQNRKAVEHSYIFFFLDMGNDLTNWIYPGYSNREMILSA